MFRQKKQNHWTDMLFLIVLCLVMDFLMLGICGTRLFHWTRMGYIIALITSAPWPLILGAGFSSLAVATLVHGQVIYELALTVLLGVTALFLLQRTISLSFARSVLASFLITAFMMGGFALQVSSAGSFYLSPWTFFQIIANIIIINLLLKYTS